MARECPYSTPSVGDSKEIIETSGFINNEKEWPDTIAAFAHRRPAMPGALILPIPGLAYSFPGGQPSGGNPIPRWKQIYILPANLFGADLRGHRANGNIDDPSGALLRMLVHLHGHRR